MRDRQTDGRTESGREIKKYKVFPLLPRIYIGMIHVGDSSRGAGSRNSCLTYWQAGTHARTQACPPNPTSACPMASLSSMASSRAPLGAAVR